MTIKFNTETKTIEADPHHSREEIYSAAVKAWANSSKLSAHGFPFETLSGRNPGWVLVDDYPKSESLTEEVGGK